MTFRFRDGYSVPGVPAQAAGEELDRIAAENRDTLTPKVVVNESRPDDAVLHPAFEWDDEIAAEHWREDQARRLIRGVSVITTNHDGEQEQVLRHVSVVLPEEGRCYVTTERATNDADLSRQVEEEALRALQALEARYRHIQSLRRVFVEVRRAAVRRHRPQRPAEVVAGRQ